MKDARLLLTIPLIVYVLIAVFWQTTRVYSINGDEPHYLLITESILRDGDVLVDNNTYADSPVLREMPPGFRFSSAHSFGGYSQHGLGLPVLLLPVYALAGVTGSKIFMAALAGLIPFAVYQLVRIVLNDDGWAVLTALVIALGQPFLAASNQIYPDLLGGLLVFYCAVQVFRLSQTPSVLPGPASLALVGLAIALLPWLHEKFLPAALLLYLAMAGLMLWRKGDESETKRARQFVGLAGAAVGISVASLLLYTLRAYGSLENPIAAGGLTADPVKNAMIFVGLHLDRAQGLFAQAPVLMLGLLGLAFLAAENPGFVLIWALLYLAIIGPHAANAQWYGNYGFSGRFMWSVILLWVFPLAYAVRLLLARHHAMLIGALFALEVALQAVTASVVLTVPGYLYNSDPLAADPWLLRAPIADVLKLNPLQVARWLPSFRSFDAYYLSPINWAAIGLVVGLIVTGECLRRRASRLLLPAWGAAGVAAITALLAIPPIVQPISYLAWNLPSQVGQAQAGERIAGPQDAGYVVFGPNIALWQGIYRVSLSYESGPAWAGQVTWDCVLTTPSFTDLRELGQGSLPSSQSVEGQFAESCTVPPEANLDLFQFRVYTSGGANIKLTQLTIEPSSLTAAAP